MAGPRPPSKSFDLDITVVSAKHLKNVNWRHGDLKPYAIFWVDPDRRHATKSDDSGSTRPVWNERFSVPLSLSPEDSLFTLEIFHSTLSDTPKALVGILRFPLKDLVNSVDSDSTRLRNFELRRPSGRPQGKIRLKLAVRERPLPDYPVTSQPSYYYSSAPPPPPPAREYRGFSPSPPYTSSLQPPPQQDYPYGAYSEPFPAYYTAYYSQPQPQPPPARPFFDRQPSSGGPSAPEDYAPYDQKSKGGGKMGLGSGLAVGAVSGALGGLALGEGLKYEEEKIADRAERDVAAKDDYSDYRVDY